MWFDDLLSDLDARWEPTGAGRITLRVIGSVALFLRTSYARGTKDGDIIETSELAGVPRAQIERLAGPRSMLARTHGAYLEVVSRNVPMLSHAAVWHPHPTEFTHLRVEVLDAADVVCSKLARFNATDREDVEAMIEGGHVTQARMGARLFEIIERYRFDGRADRLPEMARRFNELERGFFTEQTVFEFPEEWFR